VATKWATVENSDVVQGLSIDISANAEPAVAGLEAVDAAAKQTVDNIAAANERLGTSAQQTREQIAEAARATAEAAQLAKGGFEKVGAAAEASSAQVHTATKEMADLKARFADDTKLIGESADSFGVQAIQSAAQRAKETLANALGTGGMYTPTDHIGTLASHATGAKGSYSYTDYGAALAAIEQGLQTNSGSIGAFNTYSVRRSMPDYNLALMSGAQAVQQALQTGTGPVAAAVAASNAAAKTNAVGANEPRVVVNAQNSTFVGADGISGLTDLITTALARKQHGTLPNPTAKRVLSV